MHTTTISKSAIWVIAAFLGLIALRPFYSPDRKVSADTPRFDHIVIVAPLFLHMGKQGLLLMDKRNGNVWFLGKEPDELNLKYGEPAFVTRIPLEKLDRTP